VVRSDLVGGLSPEWDQTYVRSRAIPSLAGPRYRVAGQPGRGSGDLRLLRPAEGFARPPHGMHRHRETARQSHLGTAHAAALARRMAQAFNADQRPRVIIALAATYSCRRMPLSPILLIRPVMLTSPELYCRGVRPK
jgi:hypothetical protein